MRVKLPHLQRRRTLRSSPCWIKRGTLRLLVLNSATDEVENDVTELVTKFSLAQVYRFQISANGRRLAVGSRESFVVIDLPSRKILLEQDTTRLFPHRATSSLSSTSVRIWL